MFKDYEHVLKVLQLEKLSETVYRIDDEHSLVMIPILQKPITLIRIKRGDLYVFVFNDNDFAVIEHPEQMYHVLKAALAQIQ